MLSDEITTGAVKQSDSERKSLAAKSHAWNAAQPKFKTLFPEYAGEQLKDLPNMSGKAPEPAGPQGEGKAPPGVSLSFPLFASFFFRVEEADGISCCFCAEQLVNRGAEKAATAASTREGAAMGSSPQDERDAARRQSRHGWIAQLAAGRGLLALAVLAAMCAVAARHFVYGP